MKSLLDKKLLKKMRKNRWLIGGVTLVILLPFIVWGVFELFYINRAYPGIYVGDVSFSGKNKYDVVRTLESVTDERKKAVLSYSIPDASTPIEIGKVGDYASYDLEKTSEKILNYGRRGSLFDKLKDRFRFIYSRHTVFPDYGYDRASLEVHLAEAVRPFENPVINSSLQITPTGVSVSPSKAGVVAKIDESMSELEAYLAFVKDTPNFKLQISPTDPAITENDARSVVSKAEQAVSRSLVLKSETLSGSVWNLKREELFSFLTLKKDPEGKVDIVFEDYKVASYAGQIASLLERQPVDAKFQLEGDRVTVFEPAQPGVMIDTVALTNVISERALNSSTPAEIEIPVKTEDPAITTSNVNNYGIKELVGKGTSKFRGSPAGRIHNLRLAASKLNGVLIAPGEEFSMYKYVGEVEKSTGYQDAFIIKDGRTVPGVGGGLCQVSTTLFRTVLNAGLPITERHQHAYRVYYYEQDAAPGIDAAVYFPTWDFKFKNDTGNYLLLQTKVDTKLMTAEFNLYGVKDGRVVELTKPVVTNVTPPPPELRVDDPNLPRGQENEVDHAVAGADVSFSRNVMKDGQQIISDTFKSKYKAWQRVVMVGIKD